MTSPFFVFRPTDSRQEFIRLYSDSYYLDDGNIHQIAPNASGSRKSIEDMMDAILESGIRSKLDVVRILTWEISRLKQEDMTCPECAEDWKDLQNLTEDDITQELTVERYGESFQIGMIAVLVLRNIHRLEAACEECWMVALKELSVVLKYISGLGSVYLITLMYFLSRRAYPICDRFAMMALLALKSRTAPGGEVEYRGLPSVLDLLEYDDPEFGYQRYIELLEAFFNEEITEDGKLPRGVDRALWVYGHYFTPVFPAKKK